MTRLTLRSIQPASWVGVLLVCGSCCLPYLVPESALPHAEVWKSDGTPAGTLCVRKLPAELMERREPFAVAGDTLFFGVNELHPQLADCNAELWKSDGTSAGTDRVVVISHGELPFHESMHALDLHNAALGRNLLFLANDAVHGLELWKSDGTAAGTGTVKDRVGAKLMPSNLVGIGGTVFFLAKASPAATRAEIWKSDGTSGGTVRVSNLEASGACLVEFGGSLFFTGGGSLWKSDGTPEGTVALKDLGQYVGCGSAAPHAADGTLFIAMHDRLWKSDGTPRGTVFVKEYPPGFFLQISLPPVHIGATLFFLLTDNSTMQLWKSDGTGPGTVRLKQDAVDPIVDPGTRLFALGHQLLFAGKDAEHGTELWTSDGTEAGTRLLADLEPGRQSSGPEGFIELGGRALFSASAAGRSLPYQPRTSLWTSDGTTAGTTLVRPHVDSRRMARMGKDVYWIRPR